ncbi:MULTISPECIES: hypothetical protein [Acidobacteriaceae]|uniref:hypothetical protein n=1 Tax=Acidobacteriaceae TaxID=204434 RepID=UPI00131E4077|nr:MULTISPECIES: hypothetical protein [Acidobacteriaceae]MDW5267596.1 hypothetical protein [Edaphobacter sp.]
MKNAVSWMLPVSGVNKFELELPDGVEGSTLSGAGKKILMLVNVADGVRSVALPHPMFDILTRERKNTIVGLHLNPGISHSGLVSCT